jgi:REP-associated tyrosine transposase
MRYRRAKTPGGSYFFTVVTHKRRPILCEPSNVQALRAAFRTVMQKHPFRIDAFVLLPDHIHCIWTLPIGDHDFSTRWRLVKSYFSRNCSVVEQDHVSPGRIRKQERGIWQQRFWEHLLRDEIDFARHVEYIHYNPVKHRLVNAPSEWLHSSFHRYVKAGDYPADWGASMPIQFDRQIGKE